MNENYFKSNKKLYEQKEGIPMGSPTSGIMSEIFLQNMENEHSHDITRKNKIAPPARYVDDILIIYDSVISSKNYILNDLNSIHKKIRFIHENEIYN